MVGGEREINGYDLVNEETVSAPDPEPDDDAEDDDE